MKGQTSIKIRFRVLVTFENVNYDVDGNKFCKKRIDNMNAQKVIKYNMATHEIEVEDEKRKPIGSGWRLISVDKLNVDIYRIKK